MRSVLLPLSLLPSVLGATIYLAGDSTMAASGGGSGTDGWGQYVDDVSITVSNKAIGGRSARSYTREGRFDAIADLLQEGDYVVIEFGHNDGGSLSTDNGRTDCPGTASETCETTYDGQAETVLTFPAYLENAAKTFVDKGAKVLISSQTPNNVWESGEYSYSPSRFVEYAQLAAETAGVDYVDHGAYVAARYEALGADTVNSYYPNDHTHTSPEGAQVVADAFLKAVACSDVALKEVLTSTDFPGDCL
ncbi:rhamnogalacturonan acetylesterase RgaE [Aspergillus flavus]|nr:rhamnogalacturonan acetylesterase RgaE [Aspergillus flavus]KOC07225.1 rhamnogalacturonan acetylesterase RgaE [Aspergillus flavus AF70]RAQ42679.1 rhamnogalacturonan acetylesterase RgaE [Aspergillus flavus]RAQ67281.1 rhamnogalacturonan acetylesterase RgaE [Aspergillus flavus]RAQ79418.1 rhamnogalacturonan acetylesterase RgaE [Aspergillus flavus]